MPLIPTRAPRSTAASARRNGSLPLPFTLLLITGLCLLPSTQPSRPAIDDCRVSDFGALSCRDLCIENRNITRIPLLSPHFQESPLFSLSMSGCAVTELTLVDTGGENVTYPIVTSLLFVSNAITYISPTFFDAFPALSALNLYNNRLTAINVRWFAHLPELIVLDISTNAITSVPPHAFSALTSLGSLFIYNNRLTDIHPMWFGEPGTRSLSLSTASLGDNVHLQTLHNGTFANTNALTSLELSNCAISTLPEDLFVPVFSKLDRLQISNTFGLPTMLQPNRETVKALSVIQNIRRLHLRGQRLFGEVIFSSPFMDPLARELLPLFQNVEQFQDRLSDDAFDFQAMGLVDVPWLLRHIPKLPALKLGDNDITELSAASFVDLPALKSLSLVNNRISRIGRRTFSSILGTLTSLDMLGNPSVCDLQPPPAEAASGTLPTINCTCAPGLAGDGTFCEVQCPLHPDCPAGAPRWHGAICDDPLDPGNGQVLFCDDGQWVTTHRACQRCSCTADGTVVRCDMGTLPGPPLTRMPVDFPAATKRVELESTEIVSIPRGAFLDLPLMQEFNAIHAGPMLPSKHALDGTALRRFGIRGSDMLELPLDLLEALFYTVRSQLDISTNPLLEVAHLDVISRAPLLKFIDLDSSRQLRAEITDPSADYPFLHLNEIQLNFLNLDYLPAWINRLDTLLTLELKFFNIPALDRTTFAGLDSLETLILNPLTALGSIAPDTFAPLPNLRNLELISEIAYCGIQPDGNPNCTCLDISDDQSPSSTGCSFSCPAFDPASVFPPATALSSTCTGTTFSATCAVQCLDNPSLAPIVFRCSLSATWTPVDVTGPITCTPLLPPTLQPTAAPTNLLPTPAPTLNSTADGSADGDAGGSASGGGGGGGGGGMAVVGASVAIVLVALGVVIFVVARRRRNKSSPIDHDFHLQLHETVGESFLRQFEVLDRSRFALAEFNTLELPRGAIVLGEVLADGRFGPIYKARYRATSDALSSVAVRRAAWADGAGDGAGETQVCVAKLCDTADPRLRRSGLGDLHFARRFLVRARALVALRHPCIVSVLGVVTHTQPIMLVQPFYANGNLHTFLRACRPGLPTRQQTLQPTDLLIIATRLAAACVFLESKNIVHRNIKCRSLLIGATPEDTKLSGFHRCISTKKSEGGDANDTDTDVEPAPEDDFRWLAPECAGQRPQTTKSDVWAFGVTCWEILSYGRTPFGAVGKEELARELSNGLTLQRPPSANNAMFKLLQETLVVKPAFRPGFSKLHWDLIGQTRVGTAATAGMAAPPSVTLEAWQVARESLAFVRDLEPASAFGMVQLFEASNLLGSEGRHLVAVHRLAPGEADNELREDQFLRELSLLSTLHHPNVLRLLGVCSLSRPILALLELAPLGRLSDVVANQVLGSSTLLAMGLGVVRGAGYLASRRLVHRSFGADSCYVMDNFTVKVAAVGISRMQADKEYYSVHGGAVRLHRVMAPESLLEAKFTVATNVFDVGVVLFQLMTQMQLPFAGMDQAELLRCIRARQLPPLEMPRSTPPRAREVVVKCCQLDPAARPSFPDIEMALEDAGEGEERWEYAQRESLEFVRELGAGQFGVVQQMTGLGLEGGSSPDDTRTCVAVKTLSSEDQAAQASFLREMQLMMRLRHPNLVRLLRVCTKQQPFLMLLEFLPGGSLESWLEGYATRKEQPHPSDLIHVLHQVALGMTSLHAAGIVHRDLAARNILIGSSILEVKIADYGLSRDMEEHEYYRLQTGGSLPIRWMAPETLREHKHTPMSDVYSFGTLAFECFSLGGVPFNHLSNGELMEMLFTGTQLELKMPSWAPRFM